MQDMRGPSRIPGPERGATAEFVRRVLIVAGVAAAVFLLWQLREAFLLAFAACIVAVLLLAVAEPIRRHTPLSHRWSLAIACILILAAVGLLFWLLGAEVRAQISDLVRQLPSSWSHLEEQLGFSVPPAGGTGQGSGLVAEVAEVARNFAGRLLTYGYMTFQIVTTFILVVIGGVFIAADPGLHRRGLVKLFPPNRHRQVGETVDDSGRALRQWLLAQLVSMSVVGVLAGFGTWLIGLPSPLALGLFAALTEFVPIVGPIIGAIPALLLALTAGSGTFLWTLLLYLGVQQVESNLITPLVQERMVTIPPAVLLIAVVAFGILFGPLGVLVASPLAVVAYVAVKKLYVRDTLGEETSIPGEGPDAS
ncbi:MAG TPA: AI-2E family transporter [Paracoccaceae bacterium]|nr:AI-2E family transporter [Paracoccaceae bacterium]